MTKEQEYIHRNNRLRQKLTSNNEKFYSDFLIYLRSRSLIQDQESVEAKLLEILQDILDAQADHVTAEEYFGKDAKGLADDLLSQLPKNTIKFLKGTAYILALYLFFTFLPSMISPNTRVDLGAILIAGVYTVAGIFLAFRYLSDTIYKTYSKTNHKWLRYISSWLVGCLLIAPIFLINIFVHTPFNFFIGQWLGIGIILLFLLVGLALFLKQHEKILWLPFALFFLAIGVLGIAMRVPGGLGIFLSNTAGGQTIAGFLLLAALIIFLIANFLVAKKSNSFK